MTLDVRTAQTEIENALRDAILCALGRRLPAVASVAALRATATAGESSSYRSDDDLINIVVSSAVSRAYRWSSESTATDNGTTIIKPTDVSANGRWLAWTSSLRFSPEVGGDAYYLHEILDGPLRRVLLLDPKAEDSEIDALLAGETPTVVISSDGDDPSDATQIVGTAWFTNYKFSVSIVDENLRDRREAAQGSSVTDDVTYGANKIDGFIKALLAGTQLYAVLDGLRVIRTGPCVNSVTEHLQQRRIIRERQYSVMVTEENPNAPNDYGPVDEVDRQAQLADLGDQTDDNWDDDNYVASGITVPIGVGLSKPIAAGSAQVEGSTVTYAGELKTFSSYADTYRDLNPDGTLTFVEIASEGEAPAVTSGAMRIGITRTDGSQVLFDHFIARTKSDFLADFQQDLTS